MRAAEQQIMGLLCAGVYEADHYCGFMVYIGATSPRHVWRSIDYGARGSVACYPLPHSPNCTHQEHGVK